MKYFLDTYALVQIVRGDQNYQKYLSEELATSLLNLYELYYVFLKDTNEETAKEFFYEFLDIVVEVKEEHIFAAAKLKLQYKKTNISYTDALGYAIAEQEGMRFLTGDKEFKNLPNVEFAPKGA